MSNNGASRVVDHNIFDLAPFPMWIYDINTFRFLAVNKEAVKHYGYTEREFLEMTIRDIRPEEDIPRLEIAVKEARTRTESYKESLFRHRKKNGDIIYVLIKSNLLTYNGVAADIVTAIDQTDRYERTLKIDTQKTYLKANNYISQILIGSNDWIDSISKCFEIIGRTIHADYLLYISLSPLDLKLANFVLWKRDWNIKYVISEIVKDNLRRTVTSLKHDLLKKKYVHLSVDDVKYGTSRFFLRTIGIKNLLIVPIILNNRLFGIVSAASKSKEGFNKNDIELFKNLSSNLNQLISKEIAHEQLKQSESKFKSLIQNGKDMIAILDHKANYLYVSSSAQKVLGYPSNFFIGKNAFNFIHEDDQPRLLNHLNEILINDSVSIEPYRFPDAFGNWKWIKTELSNHFKTLSINGIVANTHDVTAEMEKKIIDDLVSSMTLAISQPGSLVDSLQHSLKVLLERPKIKVCEFWMVSQDSSRLDLISQVVDPEMESFRSNITSFKKFIGLPGAVWKENKMLIWGKIHKTSKFIRRKYAQSVGLRTGIGFPIIYNKKIIGCITCLSISKKADLQEDALLLSKVARYLGPVIQQKITEVEYRSFFNISPDPHCIIGYDGYIKKYNQSFIDLFGYPSQKLTRIPIYDFIYSKDKKSLESYLRLFFKGKAPHSFQGRFLTADKKMIWLICSGTAIPESKVVIAVAKDITDQKLAENKLQTAYKRLQTAQTIAKLGYWTLDFATKNINWNNLTYEIFEEDISLFHPTLEDVFQRIHPDDRNLFQNTISEFHNSKTMSIEHRIITMGGKTKWVHEEIQAKLDSKNEVFKIEATIQDITERKEYEQELAISNDRFRLAMEASNEMIWEIDHSKNIITRGNGYENLILYKNFEPFNKDNSWVQNIYQKDRKRVWKSFNKAISDKEISVWSIEYRAISLNGEISYFIDRCHILRDLKGIAIRSIGSALNVTTSRQQLVKIKEQNSKLREIAWLQSHVLRAPLARILSLIYSSNNLESNDFSVEEIMQHIKSSALEMDEVIKGITEKTNYINNEDERNFTH